MLAKPSGKFQNDLHQMNGRKLAQMDFHSRHNLPTVGRWYHWMPGNTGLLSHISLAEIIF